MKSVLNMDVLFGGYYASKEQNSDRYGLFRLLDFGPDAYQAALFLQKFDQVPTIVNWSDFHHSLATLLSTLAYFCEKNTSS